MFSMVLLSFGDVHDFFPLFLLICFTLTLISLLSHDRHVVLEVFLRFWLFSCFFSMCFSLVCLVVWSYIVLLYLLTGLMIFQFDLSLFDLNCCPSPSIWAAAAAVVIQPNDDRRKVKILQIWYLVTALFLGLHSGMIFKTILGNIWVMISMNMMIVCVIRWFIDLRHPKRLRKNQQIITNMMIFMICLNKFPWKIDQIWWFLWYFLMTFHGKLIKMLENGEKHEKCEEYDDFWNNFMMILGSFPAERRFLG